MKINLKNLKREPLFRAEVPNDKPASIVRDPENPKREIYLNWDSAFDDHGTLRRCPVCGCSELFARKDFPQVTGFVVVIIAALVSMYMVGIDQIIPAVAVLAIVVVIDLAVFFFTGKCLVCYRCRSEFRDTPIAEDHSGWDLPTGEKYRPVNQGESANRDSQ